MCLTEDHQPTVVNTANLKNLKIGGDSWQNIKSIIDHIIAPNNTYLDPSARPSGHRRTITASAEQSMLGELNNNPHIPIKHLLPIITF